MNHRDAALRRIAIIEAIRAGRAPVDIARDHGVTRAMVTILCRRAGVAIAPRNITDRKIAAAAKREQTVILVRQKLSRGYKIKDIASDLSLSPDVVYRWLRNAGHSLRNTKRANGDYA